MSSFKKPVCKVCPYYVFTPLLSAPEGAWHCESGFRPFHESWYYCVEEAELNYKAFLKQNGGFYQLKLF